MEVRCKRCGYIWDSKTRMYIVSCPRCGAKVRINFSNNLEGDKLNGTDGSIGNC